MPISVLLSTYSPGGGDMVCAEGRTVRGREVSSLNPVLWEHGGSLYLRRGIWKEALFLSAFAVWLIHCTGSYRQHGLPAQEEERVGARAGSTEDTEFSCGVGWQAECRCQHRRRGLLMAPASPSTRTSSLSDYVQAAAPAAEWRNVPLGWGLA